MIRIYCAIYIRDPSAQELMKKKWEGRRWKRIIGRKGIYCWSLLSFVLIHFWWEIEVIGMRSRNVLEWIELKEKGNLDEEREKNGSVKREIWRWNWYEELNLNCEILINFYNSWSKLLPLIHCVIVALPSIELDI